MNAPENDRADPGPLPDEALSAREEHERFVRLGKALEEMLVDDPVAVKVYRAAMDGVQGHAEQAARAGCATGEVRLALKRVKYHWLQLLEREAAADRRPVARRPAAPKGGFGGGREESTS